MKTLLVFVSGLLICGVAVAQGSNADADSNAQALMASSSKSAPVQKVLQKNASPTQAKHKSVESEEPETEYWKGSPFPQDNNVFLGLGFDYFDSFGIQARYARRLLKYGFIPDVNDSFFVEGGLGTTFYGTVRGQSTTGINFVALVRWDFQLDPMWTLFADLGFGYNGITGADSSFVNGGGLFPAFGVGGMYNFNSEWAIRGDLSYQFLGVGLLYRF